jgi:thiamine biosynthesis lipoprotein
MTVVHPTPTTAADLDRAFSWFRDVETSCSRFDPDSELSRLCARPGQVIPVSDVLFEAVSFALAVADASDGAFDPTVGAALVRRGFDRHYATGAVVTHAVPDDTDARWRDVRCDPDARTIRLARPLLLDLGGIAKGLAIDLAARTLHPYRDFAIDAGGDLYLSGHNPDEAPWTVGIQHPRRPGALLDTWQVTDAAVCTSGDYEREGRAGHHLLDPRTGDVAHGLASATVLAPTAMLADAAATAAFVLGADAGLSWCRRLSVTALLVTDTLDRHETGTVPRVP